MESLRRKTVELLAPARDYLSAVAAVDYGADAVYMGGAKFGARQAAGNAAEEIARAVGYAHRYGVRVHATLNTLLWDDELEEAERQARELIAAGSMRSSCRTWPCGGWIFRSSCTPRRRCRTARPKGRGSWARRGSRASFWSGTFRSTKSARSAARRGPRWSVSCTGRSAWEYSGRCFLSRSMSARSGNRGACSQPCRLTYDLTDGRGHTYIAGKHLLSVRDMNLSAHLGELLDAGVTSFKIEGRLKDVNYIRNVVAFYRRATDEALAARPRLGRASVGESVPDFTPDTAKSFTRGESEYFFAGRCAGVASFDTPKAVGERIGRVVRVERGAFRLDAAEGRTLAAGDGICFVTPGGLVGTNVNAAEGGRIVPRRMEGIVPGAEVFRNYDRAFTLRVERSRTRRVIPSRRSRRSRPGSCA